MKKSILLSLSAMLFAGHLFAQNPLVLTTTVTAATQCTAPCNGTATVTNVSGGTPPYTYLWNVNPPQQTQTATGLCPGQWQVGVWDATTPFPNQGTVLVTITCNTASGINSLVDSKNDVIIYPNPVSDELSLEGNNMMEGNSQITIYNTLGMIVYSESLNANGQINKKINTSSFPAGVYSVEVLAGSEGVRKNFIKH